MTRKRRPGAVVRLHTGPKSNGTSKRELLSPNHDGRQLPLEPHTAAERALAERVRRLVIANGYPAPARVLVLPHLIDDLFDLGAYCERIARELNAPIAVCDAIGRHAAFAQGYREDGTYEPTH
jgi:hypothetical protein